MQVQLMLDSYERNPQADVDFAPNPTMIPDGLFWSMTPIILVRHPALRVPAYYRAQRPVFREQADEEVFEAMASSRWAQMVFDAYTARPGARAPIVVDAQDTVHHTRPLAEKICALLDIDPKGMQYEWEAVPRGQWPSDPIMQGFFKTLLKSHGVQREGQVGNSCSRNSIQADLSQPAELHLDIEHEMRSWEHGFGQETAKELRRVVDRDLPIYEYLRQYKLHV